MLVICSGGLDSFCTVAIQMKRRGRRNMKLITADYGQDHRREVESAKWLAKKYNLEHKIFKFDPPYDDMSTKSNLRMYFRNGIFLSYAATQMGRHETLAVGIEYDQDDDSWDTHRRFYDTWERLISYGIGRKIKVWTPAHEKMWRYTMIEQAHKVIGDDIFKSHTCQSKLNMHCGRCDACLSRYNTIEMARLIDKTKYKVQPYRYAKLNMFDEQYLNTLYKVQDKHPVI